MSIHHRAMMFLMVQIIKSKKTEELDNDSKGVLATYGKTVDFTKRANIAPIIAEIEKSN